MKTTPSFLKPLLTTLDHVLNQTVVFGYDRVGYYVRKPLWNEDDTQVDMTGKICVVTGANSGLGFAATKALAAKGAHVIMACRNAERGEKARLKIQEATDNPHLVLELVDLSRMDDVRDFCQRLQEKYTHLDVLINNAGIYGPKGYIEKVNWDEWVKAIEINLFGSILLCRAVIPYFKKKNKGKIIQLSGGGAASPLPLISSYAVSKAAIVRFVENLSEEVKNYNIDINAIAPGPLNTGMLKEVLKAGPQKVGKEFYKKSLKQKETGGTPFSKVCELILFLGSKYSDGIRGKLISALWDDWKNWVNYKQLLQNSDAYTLRRIVGKDRGFEWGDK